MVLLIWIYVHLCNLCIGTNPSEYKFFFQQLLVYVVVLHNAHTNVRISEREWWKQKKMFYMITNSYCEKDEPSLRGKTWIMLKPLCKRRHLYHKHNSQFPRPDATTRCVVTTYYYCTVLFGKFLVSTSRRARARVHQLKEKLEI